MPKKSFFSKKLLLMLLGASALSLTAKAQNNNPQRDATTKQSNEITIKPYEIKYNPNSAKPLTLTVRQGKNGNYTYNEKVFQPWELLYINEKLVLGGRNYITGIEKVENSKDKENLYFFYKMHTLIPIDSTNPSIVTEETFINGVVFDRTGNVIALIREDDKNFPEISQSMEIRNLINEIQKSEQR